MDKLRRVEESGPLEAVCLLVLLGILVAGLWPFWPQRNAVTWLDNANGLSFGNYGSVFSSGAFQAPTLPQAASRSVEVWVQPGPASDNVDFLSFSTAEDPRQLSLEQYHDSFLILRHVLQDPPPSTSVIGIAGVFRETKLRFITVTSSPIVTSIYVDGVLRSTFPRFPLAQDFMGELAIGTSPLVSEHWRGQLRGIAIYDGELTAPEVLAHYEVWTMQARPPLLVGNPRAIAVYGFNERAGNVIHNAVPSGIDLYIPERFALARQPFLEPFWKEYRSTWGYWKDILVNIAGFIPLGFFFCAYWSRGRPLKRAVIATVMAGFAVSLTIEVAQAWLPTRASGTTDLMTNTLGTFLGALLFGSRSGGSLMDNLLVWYQRGRQARALRG
jgi:VanZ family protein